MSKDTNNLIVDIIKRQIILIAAILVIIVGAIYVLFIIDSGIKAPIPQIVKNIKSEKTLKEEIKNRKKDLERILEDNKLKNEAAKNATVKEFFSVVNPTGDTTTDFVPMFDNVITIIKQNGLRMKSIKYSGSPMDDNLIKNGSGAYDGCKVDFELVGYYPQFMDFLNELKNYPYFINIAEFKIVPYQYDKRILISNVSIIFYSKNK